MNWLAQFSRRHLLTTSIIVVVETIFYRLYAHLGGEFHFWLHGLFGAALGVSSLTVWRLIKRPSGNISAWEAGALGHLYSAVPDILFVTVGVLHMYWMDVFALHISIHFIPYPVITMLGIFIISLMAYGFVSQGHPRQAVAALLVAGVILGTGLVLRQPIPRNLYQLQQRHSAYAWLCPMWDIVGNKSAL